MIMRLPASGHRLMGRTGAGVSCLLALAVGCGPSADVPATTPGQTSTTTATGSSTSSAGQVDDVLSSAVGRQDVLGVVAMAVDRDGVVYRGAFGTADDADDLPIRTDVVFRIASMTKPVTSVAAMQLVERGAIALDEPAASYLPELAQAQVLERSTGSSSTEPSVRCS
jgi:CubicO group peptidase (beta-lactamase class C family)